MTDNNAPEVGSKWTLPGYSQVEVKAVTPRGKPPGKQVKFEGWTEAGFTADSLALKKFNRLAEPV